MGILYLVATPIGNLDDLSKRVIETLRNVSKIYAEDTRRTGNLLSKLNINIPISSYFEHNEQQKIPTVVQELQDGHDIALVSDAGTPTVSDPGFKLVREAITQNITVIAIPGPNAAIMALTVSGLPTDRFTFGGFLPKKEAAAKKILTELKDLRSTLIFYESPFRITKTLAILKEVLGNRPASISRELTKLHEETVHGDLVDLIDKFQGKIKGELTIVVGSEPVSKLE